MKLWPVVSFLLAVSLAVCIFLRPSTGHVGDASRDQHIDSAPGIQRADSAALVHADTAIARSQRDSAVIADLADSAKRMGRRLDELDRLAALRLRQKRAATAARDSAIAVVDSMVGSKLPDTLALDTATVELAEPDSSLSCESRYTGRLAQLSLLGDALERCRARGDTVRVALIGVRDTLKLTKGYLHVSDSLLKWERDRPRDCTQDLVVTEVACWKVDAGVGVVGIILGLFVRR